jgi:threonine aldolase
MIDAMLKPWEAVASVVSGHINVHEAGSIESTGHRIEPLPEHDGKMDPVELEKLCIVHEMEHMTDVRGVYISQATEVGTIYSKEELLKIREVCDKYGLYLFVDGARMGSGVIASGVTLREMAQIADCFYIGATKNGGMIGEAMVIVNDDLKPCYRRLMKQHGALLAKGFILGIQFDTLFTDDLFFRLARHENEVAEYLVRKLKELGVRFFMDSPTNQQFIYLKNEAVEELKKNYGFEVWEVGEEETVIRFVTSFASRFSDVDQLVSDLKELL